MFQNKNWNIRSIRFSLKNVLNFGIAVINNLLINTITWCIPRLIQRFSITKTEIRFMFQIYYFLWIVINRAYQSNQNISYFYRMLKPIPMNFQNKKLQQFTKLNSPGFSLNFFGNPLPDKLNWGPLSKFIFSGLYVPGAIRKIKYKKTLI